MQLRVLGPVIADIDGRPVDLGWRQERCVLGLLLLDPGQPLSVERLIDLGWEHPPKAARRAVQVTISRLRARLSAISADQYGVRLERAGEGYALQAPLDRVDSSRFRHALTEARATAGPDVRSTLLRNALALWRGPVLADVGSPQFHQRVGAAWEEERLAVVEELAALELAAGRHREVVPELVKVVAAEPTNEKLHAQLMLALYRSDRRIDALAVYRSLRTALVDQFGVEPTTSVRALHQRILAADEELDRKAAPPVAADPAARVVDVPRQLPMSVTGFVGRDQQLQLLDDLLPTGDRRTGVAVAAIVGPAGTGKSTLATHWCHRVSDQFPDGQFYVDLRGFHPTEAPRRPAEVLSQFLAVLGVRPDQLPNSTDELMALFRTRVADRRMLFLLDNARDAAQVRPLLTGAPESLVLTTSRNALSGLVAVEGARAVALSELEHCEALELLASRIGRAGTTDADLSRIVESCGRLPLALVIAAARATAGPNVTVADVADELSDRRRRLAALAGDEPGTDLRAVLDCSYRVLSAEAARLFRLLPIHPGHDFDLPAAASLVGLDRATTQGLIAELLRSHLLSLHRADRYALHDLVREYAHDLAMGNDSAPDLTAALARTISHYLHSAHSADTVLGAPRWRPPPAPPDGVAPEVVRDQPEATAWFEAHRRTLSALIDVAAVTDAGATWRLAGALANFLCRAGYRRQPIDVLQIALSAAERAADPVASAECRRLLGRARAVAGESAAAHTELVAALEQLRAIDDKSGLAITNRNIAWLYEQDGDDEASLEHNTRALELYLELSDLRGQALALNAVGWNHARMGAYDLALDRCGRAITILAGLGDNLGLAVTLDSLGYIHHQLGNLPEAMTCYVRALELLPDSQDRYNRAEVLVHLGDAHLADGNRPAADKVWLEAARILADLDHPQLQVVRDKLGDAN